MSPPPEWRIACADCEVIGRPWEVVVLDPDEPVRLDDFLTAHRRVDFGPVHRLVLLDAAEVVATVPRPGWTPRPVYGPPLPGEAQDVVCPTCNACGGADPRSDVVWKRTAAGDPFLFCRIDGYTWGPGADAERSRMLLRSLGER